MSEQETPLNEKNHVVRSATGYRGTWGRGTSEEDARKKAYLKKTDPYDYFLFKDDSWDILTDGSITWESDTLLYKARRNIKKTTNT